jgi:hypothetical protein
MPDLRCSATHRANLQGLKHSLSGQYLIINGTPHPHEVRTSHPILRFMNSLYSSSRRMMSLRPPVLSGPEESRRRNLTTTFHLLLSHLMRHIQQPNDTRQLAKNGPYLMNFATHSGGYIVSLCSRCSYQQLAKFLSSHPLSRKTFRREWSRAR